VGNGEPHFSSAYTSLARRPAFPYNFNTYCDRWRNATICRQPTASGRQSNSSSNSPQSKKTGAKSYINTHLILQRAYLRQLVVPSYLPKLCNNFGTA